MGPRFATARIAAAAACLFCLPAPAADRPVVGAIRWDAWHGDQGIPGRAVQRSLGPSKWHHRLPFFAQVLGDARVRIDGTPQAVMDREIDLAARAGLDHWAFLVYPPDDPMSLGLKRYLASARRGRIGFCLVTECGRWGDPAFVARLVALMREKGYRTVLDGRPLLYLGFIDEAKVRKHWKDTAGFRKVLDGFRRQAADAGLEDPYVTIMDFHPDRGKRWADALGAQAISSYATSGDGKGAPYAALAGHAERFWDRCRKTGAHVVPICMSGWDRRPRVERPVPWETWQKPGKGLDLYYEAPAPKELAGHVSRALTWVETHAAAAPARAVLIYAWNENDEGGWLVPTSGEQTARLDALQPLLAPRQ